MTPAGLLAFTLFLPAANPTPLLQRGDEFTFTGTVTEAIDRPANRFRRSHDLEVRVLVLDRKATWADAAVLTLLRRADDVVNGAAGSVVGPNPVRAPSPPATRLDLVRVHDDGTVHLLVPHGPPPLVFTKDTPARVVPAVPLDSFAPFEFGMFPPRPRDPTRPWSLASTDPNRPAETWQVLPPEFVTGERCGKLVMAQETADWEKPKGGQTDWQRVDTVWVSTRDGTARKVRRVIQHRDGIGPAPAIRLEVAYELTDRSQHIGRTYDRCRSEIELAYTAGAELALLRPDAARLGPKPFESRLERIDKYLADTGPGTPYREAVLAVRRRLDAARTGDITPIVLPVTGLTPAIRPATIPEIGKPAPDFAAGLFQLSASRGSPVVLVFFKPGSETADLSLAVANALAIRYSRRVVVVPLAVYGDPTAGVRDRDRLKLTVPVYDGSAARTAYGVETFPRFLVIDASGVLRWEFRGVGAETGYLVCQELDKLLPAPTATIGPAGAPPTASPIRP